MAHMHDCVSANGPAAAILLLVHFFFSMRECAQGPLTIACVRVGACAHVRVCVCVVWGGGAHAARVVGGLSAE